MIKELNQVSLLKSFHNKSVLIKRRTNTGTEFHPVYTWATLSTVTGMLDLLNERRVVMNEGGVVLADYMIYIDYTDVTTSDIIQIGSDQYTIYSIHNPNGLNRMLEIKALKKKPGETV